MRLAAGWTISSILTLSIGRRKSILIKCGMPHFCKMGFFMRLLSQSVSYTIGTDVILLFCGMPHFCKMDFFMRLLWLRVTHAMGAENR